MINSDQTPEPWPLGKSPSTVIELAKNHNPHSPNKA